MSGDITLCDRNPSTKLDIIDNERIVGVALRWNDKLKQMAQGTRSRSIEGDGR